MDPVANPDEQRARVALRDYTAEAFFSIEAPDETSARKRLEETVDAIDALLRTLGPTPGYDDDPGWRIHLCMESEGDRYAVEEA